MQPDEQDRALYERLRMGKEVEEFVEGHPVGKAMFNYSLHYAETGWQKFVELDPADPRFEEKARALHAEAQIPERFMQFVQDRIQDSMNAETQIRENAEMRRPDRYHD